MATATHHERRPAAKTYWLIAAFLAVITAVEIAIPYINGLGYLRAPMLIFFSMVKFFTVVGVFMHLRYDLSAFRAYFLIGLAGATVVFIVVLATFRVL